MRPAASRSLALNADAWAAPACRPSGRRLVGPSGVVQHGLETAMRFFFLAWGCTVALCAVLVAGAQAMEIRQFDKMADRDQAAYIGDLIVGAEKVLTDQHQSALAAQVKHLFTTRNPGDADTIGMIEFERNLARARLADAKRAEANSTARRLEVEDALFVTLKKNDIVLPDSFFTVNSNFRPKLPPKN